MGRKLKKMADRAIKVAVLEGDLQLFVTWAYPSHYVSSFNLLI